MAIPASAGQDPWELAKSRFLEDLEPHEKELFNNATLENIYYSTSNANRDDAEKSKTRGVAKRLGPLVSAIESYGGALDAFAQIAPQYLSPIWGSIRVVLVIASSYGKFYEKMVDTLGRIGDILPRFRDYQRIYNGQKHQRITQALSNAYLDIIILCTEFQRSIREQKSSKVRRILKPLSFDKQFDEAIERFRQHRQSVEEEARTCHMIEAAEQRAAQIVLLAAERRRNLLAKLSKVDCKYRHRKLKEARHEGTGVWFTSCPEYEGWQTLSRSSVLCCYGIPGCGKSVLVSSVIDSFDADGTPIFHYCDYADKRTLEPSNIFGALARQVLEKIEPLPESLASVIEQADHDGEKLTDHSKSLTILQKSFGLIPGTIYLILDGLDEMTESSQNLICKELRHLVEKSTIPIKLFITGREELGSLLRLNQNIPFFRVPVSPSIISLDIEKYVEASTRRRIADGLLVIRDPDLEQLIIKELVKGAKGMFLWVEFQLHDLCEPESDHGIRLVLQNLPRSLGETYDRLLSKIEGAERRDMIQRMFKWIVCAREPLNVEELREGIAFTLEDLEYDAQKLPTDFNRLVRACGNLVVVDEETQVVHLAHHTVQQYLLQQDDSPFQFTIEDANIMAGEFCVAYLSFTNFESRVTRYAENKNTDMLALERIASRGLILPSDHPGRKVARIWNSFRNSRSTPLEINMARYVPQQKRAWQPANFVFLSYVVAHWLWHTISFYGNSNDSDTNRRQETRRDRLFKNLILKKQLPFEFHPWEDFDYQTHDSSSVSLLGWALMANHPYLLKTASSNATMIAPNFLLRQAWGAVCGTLPHSIPRYGNKRLFPLDIESDGSSPLEPPSHVWLYSRLLYACRRGHLDIISASGLEFNDSVDMALHLAVVASEAGQLAILKYIRGNFFWTVFAGSHFLVESKFRKGAGFNAIEHAAISGHSHIVTFLAGEGVQPGRLCDDIDLFESIMNAAVDDNNIRMLEGLLILLGIQRDLHSESVHIDGWYMTKAMVKAAKKGYLEIVGLLLDRGVNPDTPDQHGSTLLIEAIKNSQDSVVSMLLQHNCSLGNTFYGMPLTVAASLGNLPLAHKLILNGAEIFRESFEIESFTAMASLLPASSPDVRNGQEYNGFRIIVGPTPLYMACYHGHQSIVELLLSYGASVNFSSPATIIDISEPEDPRSMTQIITNCPSLPLQNSTTLKLDSYLEAAVSAPRLSDWNLPIAAARAMGHDDIVDSLLSSGALLYEEFDSLYGCYFGTFGSQKKKLAEMLLPSITTESLPKIRRNRTHEIKSVSVKDRACRVCSVGELQILDFGSSSLQQEHFDYHISRLIQETRKSEPFCQNPLQAALVKAAGRDAIDLARALLRAGADITTCGDHGLPVPHPSLVLAAKQGNSALRDAFIDMGVAAAIEVRDRIDGSFNSVDFHKDERRQRETGLWRILTRTIGYIYCSALIKEKYCYLLYVAARSAVTDLDFFTQLFAILAFPRSNLDPLDVALFTAVNHDRYGMIWHIWEEGANINARDHDGVTPLMYAARQGLKNSIIQALLAHRADPWAFDGSGETAFCKAAANHHFHVIDVLGETGCFLPREDLRALLTLFASNGNTHAWRAVTKRELWNELLLADGSSFPSYNVSRGQYLLKKPCHQVQGLFELPVPMDFAESFLDD